LEWKSATPAGKAVRRLRKELHFLLAKDSGLSVAKEAAEAVPAESVRRSGTSKVPKPYPKRKSTGLKENAE